jgi:hypothetical protein
MDDFLGKPVLLSDLHKLIERCSARIAARRAGLPAPDEDSAAPHES